MKEQDKAITLAQAQALSAASVAHARSIGIKVCVAVCDGDGRLVAFSKMDGSTALDGHEAIRRAVTAAGQGRPSEDCTCGDSTSSTVALEGIGTSNQPGGLPFLTRDECVGGIGVCGEASVKQVIACAKAGHLPQTARENSTAGPQDANIVQPVL